VSVPTNFMVFAQWGGNQNANHPNFQTDLVNAILHLRNSRNYSTDLLDAAQLLDDFYDMEYDDNGTHKNAVGVWASLLGAVSQEEDFVEAFEFGVLAKLSQTPVDTMALQIYTTGSTLAFQPDIFKDFARGDDSGHGRKHELWKKIKKCIEAASW